MGDRRSGLLFLDAINRGNPVPALGAIEATNPCGEVPLLPNESCNLGSIHLGHVVTARADGRPRVDWLRLADVVSTAVRFLDDVIEVGRYPDAAFEEAARRTRKIGLGVMGFAELLVRLGVPYDASEAVDVAHRVMWAVRRAARRASAALAAERGVYPAWTHSVHARRGEQLRNATLTAIAPTGTIGIIADTTPSIEPMFAVAYRRAHVLEDNTLIELPRVVRDACARANVEPAIVVAAAAGGGSVRDAAELPESLRRVLVTAFDVPAEQHLRVQAAFQRFTDNSVSKTVNVPAEATREEVAAAFQQAWTLGLKGVTIYRYGSKSMQVLQLGVGEEPFHHDHATRCDPTECHV